MSEAGNRAMCVLTLLVSSAVFAWGLFKRSPSLAGTGFIAVILAAIYLFGILRLKKCMSVKIMVLQIVTLAASVIASELFDFGTFYGFQSGMLSCPVLGGAVIAVLIAYCGLRIYREVIAPFILLGSCAMGNVVGVFVYAMYASELDVTINNASSTQIFAFSFVLGLIGAFVFLGYSKFMKRPRLYTDESVLEVRE